MLFFLLLMLPLLGMLFQMRFVPLHPWPLSESSLKPTYTPKLTRLSLDHPLVFSVVLDPSSVSGYRNLSIALLVLLCLRVLLYGEIKRYKSPIRITTFKHEVPGPRFKPATSEVEGENSNRYTTETLMYMQTFICRYYTALERTLFLGHASPAHLKYWNINCDVHRAGLKLIKAGAKCSDIAKELNEIYRYKNTVACLLSNPLLSEFSII